MDQDYKFMKRQATGLPPGNFRPRNNGFYLSFPFFMFLLFMLSAIPAIAQIYPVSAYTFEQSSVTYTPITGTEATNSPTNWDDGNTSLPLGFDFIFNGTTYSTVNLSYNGYITFGTTLPSLTLYSPVSSFEGYSGAVSVFGTNLKGNEGITYTTLGNAPNRTFVVQWNNAKRFSALGDDMLNFQIRLHETTNVVDMVYGTCTAPLSNANVQAGIRGTSGSDFASRTSSASWTATTASTYSGASISTSPIIMPVSGLQFSYTPPPNCVTPSVPVAASGNITPTTATVTITPDAAPVTGYMVIRSSSPNITIPPANGTVYYTWNPLGGNPVLSVGNTTTINDTGLLPNTTYYYFVYAYNSTTCGGGPLYGPAKVVEVTTCVTGTVAATASNITATSAVLNWSQIPVGTPTYNLEVYTDAAFSNLFGTAHNGLTTTSYNLTGLTEGTTYYFRVNGTTNGGCTDTAFSTGSFTAKNGFTPLSINPADFNADVIANGPGFASSSTTHAVDNGEYSYVARDYRNNENVTGNSFGLPLNRTIVGVGGEVYLLADYSGNNSLRLSNEVSSGTLRLQTPTKLSNISIAATSGGGPSMVNAKILFSDNTSQDVTFPVNDWFDNGYYIVSGIGRVNRTDDYQNANQGDSKIFQIPVNIDFANHSKTVTGVQFAKISGEIPNIFALSGRVLTNCPAINWVSHTTTSTSTSTLNWALASFGEGATSVTYKIEVYSDAAYTVPVTGFPVQNITATTYNLTGLNMDTPYYVRIQADNGTCTSEYFTDVVMISYCVPAVWSQPNMGITNVKFGTIDKSPSGSETDDRYNNYSSLATTSWSGGIVNYSITANPGDPGYQTKIWIDFNDDTDFDDEGELISLIDNNTQYPFTATGSYTIPANAPLGNHRVRIGMAQNRFGENGPSPCSGRTADYMDFTLKIVPATCPVITVASSIVTSTSVKLDWTLVRSGGSTPSYIAEVYSDAAYTVPVTGSPFATNAQTLTLTGLASGTYYYKVRAINNTCTSDDVTGSIALMPCIPTNSPTDSLANSTSSITNVVTTGGFVNISNASGQTSGYTDYSYITVSQEAGGSFNYSVTVLGFTAVTIWVDWNNDLVFNDTNEKINTFAAPAGTFTGTITIPAGTPLGKYRMRIRSRNGSNTSPCEMIQWSEAEDYMITITTPPSCFVPQNLVATATGTIGTFSWAAPSTGDSPTGYEYVVSTSLTPPAGSGTNITETSVPVTLTANTVNYLYVRSNCGEGNYSEWAFTTFFTGYCSTPGSTPENYIDSFSTSGAITNISNTASGFSEGGYGDFTDKIVSQSALSRVNFNAAFSGNRTFGFAIWVDWNDDYDFDDAGEQVYRSTTYGNTAGGFFTLPANARLGSHRMRILADFDNAEPNNPCAFRNTRGEAEDYTLMVVPAVTCPTINAVSAASTVDGATVNWTLTPPGDTDPITYTIEVYTDNTYATQASGSPFTTTNLTYTITGLEAQTTYYYQVMAAKTGCTSAYVRGSFTTRCATAPDKPIATEEQSFTDGETVASLEVTIASGATATWYVKNEDGTYTAILTTEVLEDGKTYYVTQTVNGCESDYLAITVHDTLGRDSVVFRNLEVYPNPAIDIITIANTANISGIVIINMLGQTVADLKSDASRIQVNVAQLSAATYIMQVYSGNQMTTVKFIKQ